MTMPALDLIVPGALDAHTGGYIYDRRIVEGLSARGWSVTVHALDASFPSPSPDALRRAERVLARIPVGRRVVIDGLALGGMPALAEKEAKRLRLIALIHHPLAFEGGLGRHLAWRLRAAEQRALAATRRVIVTSAATARALADYEVPSEAIAVVQPGTDRAPLASGSGNDRLNLLCVATLIPRKGHAVLIDALDKLRDKAWHLWCVGSTTRNPSTAQRLRHQIAALGLTDRITLTGEIDNEALADCFHRADAFVLASHYEGYGMVFDEALARGLPIVGTRAGAIPETVPLCAGLLVPPGDVAALTATLRRLLEDHKLRRRLKAGACRARKALPSWEQTCTRFAAAVGDRAAA